MPKRRDEPCQCANFGCEECREQTQTAFVSAAEEALSKFSEPALLTSVPTDGLVPYDEIRDFDLEAFNRRHRVKLSRCLPDDCEFVGVVDVSLNAMENKIECWSFHYHGVLSRLLLKAEMEPLNKASPSNPAKGIYKSINVKRIKEGDLGSVLRYTYKTDFLKRSRFLTKPKGDRNPYLDSRDVPMSRKEQAMLQTYLERYSVADPIVLIGLKRVRSSSITKMRFMET